MQSKPRFYSVLIALCIAFALVAIFIVVRAILDPGRLEYWNRERKVDVPIHFFGMVVDGTEHPVSNAKIRVVVHSFRFLYILGGDRFEEQVIDCVSDVDGRFEISDVTGRLLGVRSIEYPGLVWLRETPGLYGNTSYTYSNTSQFSYKPMRGSPAVFPMLKDGQYPFALPSRGGVDVMRIGQDITETVNVPEMPKQPTITIPATR